MSRPETVQDLAEHQRAPREFLRIDLQHLTRDVAVGAAVLTLISAARLSKEFSVDEDGQFLITVPLTEEELRSRIASAQNAWDHTRDAYAATLDGSKTPEPWQRYSIDKWAEQEGLNPIDWTALDAAIGAQA